MFEGEYMNVLTKIWNWIKNHVALVIGAIGVLFAYLLGRGSLNRRGSDSSETILDDCRKGADTAGKQNRELGDQLDRSREAVDRSKEHTAGIADNNRRATEQVRTALDILERAEKRTAKAEAVDRN